MKKDPLVHIDDIYDSIKAIQKYTLGLSRADFMVSPEKQDAVNSASGSDRRGG